MRKLVVEWTREDGRITEQFAGAKSVYPCGSDENLLEMSFEDGTHGYINRDGLLFARVEIVEEDSKIAS